MFIHWMLILVFLGLLPTPANFTMWQIAAAVTVVTVASIPLAALVYVIFENPIDKIVKNEIFRF
jgi:peptidoglycan/LPS O-acetylase OafA/YrhL